MSGVQFLIDEAGHKTAVAIDLKRHKAVWEAFYDTLLTTRRVNEPGETLTSVRRRLTKANTNCSLVPPFPTPLDV